jgi:hypothetical protein
MTQKFLQIPYFVEPFKAHDLIKDQLLKLLDSQDFSSTKDDYAFISRSDWYISPGTPRGYWSVIFPYVKTHIEELMSTIGTKHYKFTNYWYAHYEINNYLNWHRHEGSGWSSIYYLRLDNNANGTLLKDPTTSAIIAPEVKEGYILTFPGIIYHSSPIINSTDKKTIIAFNIS